MRQELVAALRERAVAALEASTTMLQVAQDLHKQGNQKEAARLRNEARYKRNESILLMDEASGVAQGQSKILNFASRKSEEPKVENSSVTPNDDRRVRTG